jgi:hypothetical protein
MPRKTTQAEGAQLFRKSQIITDFMMHVTDNPADYITLLLIVLGNGVAAFAQEESDVAFERKLAQSKQVLDDVAHDARQRLINDELEAAAEETKH